MLYFVTVSVVGVSQFVVALVRNDVLRSGEARRYCAGAVPGATAQQYGVAVLRTVPLRDGTCASVNVQRGEEVERRLDVRAGNGRAHDLVSRMGPPRIRCQVARTA